MVKTTWPNDNTETNHETINNHCNNRTTAHISHKHVHSTLQTTLIQMMLFVWVTPQRCGRKVDRTLCLCIYGKECRIDRTLYSTLLNSTHFFSVVDRTPTHYFWSTGWELIRDACSRYSMIRPASSRTQEQHDLVFTFIVTNNYFYLHDAVHPCDVS